MNPIKFLKKSIVIEMGFAAAPFIGGVAGTAAAAGGVGAFGATLGAGITAAGAASGLAPVSLAAGITGGAASGGLFGGSLLSTLSVASKVVGIASTLAGGRAEAQNLKVEAKAEEFNARNREIERKRNLIRSLALQNVRAGASGITSGFGSSAQAIQLEDITRFELDQSVDAFSTTQRVNQLKQNASNATNFSLLSAGGEAARFGLRAARRGTV